VLAPAPQVAVQPADEALIDPTAPVSGCCSGLTIARRSFCRMIQAVS
jgi:hypothetical protein